MIPGITVRPVASIVRAASGGRSAITLMRPSRTPMSARTTLPPRTTSAPTIARSCCVISAPSCGRSCLLARVEQVARVERGLDRRLQAGDDRPPVALEPAALEPADAVLAADRAGEVAELGGRGAGRALRLLVAGADEEVGVDVAVPGVAPAAGLEAMAGAD